MLTQDVTSGSVKTSVSGRRDKSGRPSAAALAPRLPRFDVLEVRINLITE